MNSEEYRVCTSLPMLLRWWMDVRSLVWQDWVAYCGLVGALQDEENS